MAKRSRKIPDDRMDKFVWSKGDIKVTETNYIFPNLKPIVDKMPKDDEKALAYLQEKVQAGDITLEEFRYILKVTDSS